MELGVLWGAPGGWKWWYRALEQVEEAAWGPSEGLGRGWRLQGRSLRFPERLGRGWGALRGKGRGLGVPWGLGRGW